METDKTAVAGQQALHRQLFKRLLLVGLPFNDGNVRGMVREVRRDVISAPRFTLMAKEYHGAQTIVIL